MDLLLDDLDAAGLLAASAKAVRARRLAEVAELETLSQWAAIHSEDPMESRDKIRRAQARLQGNVLRQLGGEGTPRVQDFCLGEIAIARGTSTTSTRNALAAVLDLQHRLPLIWEVCKAGEAEVGVAKLVAYRSRQLPLADVWVVDQAISKIIASEAGGRVLEVADAKIIEANPALHDANVQAEEESRYVGYGRVNEYGIQTIIAKITSGDAQWIKATLERVTEIIAPRHPELNMGEIRSIAFGYLGRPAQLLELLLTHTDETLFDEDDSGAADEAGSDGPASAGASGLNRAIAFPADLLAALQDAGLVKKLAPKAILHIHLHEAALLKMTGAARVEELGPQSLAQLRWLLNGRNVTVQPVIDLRDRVRSTAYEHPESLKNRVHLITGGEYWPYASSTSRRVDYDHPIPYDRDGPPGQTSVENSGPLGRTHHRWKTHAGYTSRQAGMGRYVWTTPNGLALLVDHNGTRRISMEEAQMIISAPRGLDVYPANAPWAQRNEHP